jgi:hypothetical protein
MGMLSYGAYMMGSRIRFFFKEEEVRCTIKSFLDCIQHSLIRVPQLTRKGQNKKIEVPKCNTHFLQE